MTDDAFQHGDHALRKRRLVIGVTAAAAIVVAGVLIFLAVDDDSTTTVQVDAGASPTSSPIGATPPGSGPVDIETTPCDALEPPPRDIEVDTTHRPEQGIIEFFFSDPETAENRNYAIDYLNDSTCQDSPRFKALIKHVMEATEDG